MARVSSSQTGPADLPELVERLHADGAAAVADFTQDELETVIDDLPLALESESIRDHLPALLARIERRLDRTFRRTIEIARQDEARVALLLFSLRGLRWNGTPTEDEFAWLVQQMSRSLDPAARLAAYERAANLVLHDAQLSILDALGSTSMDEAIRLADAKRREAAAALAPPAPPEATPDSASLAEAGFAPPPTEIPPAMAAWAEPGGTAISRPTSDEVINEVALTNEPARDEAVIDEPLAAEPIAAEPSEPESVFDESQTQAETWSQTEQPPPARLTVRTLLRSLEPAPNLAATAERTPGEANGNGADVYPEDEPTVADDDEPTPHVENSLTGEGDAAPMTSEEGTVADESSSPEAAAAATAPAPKRQDPITVRTLLASLDSVLLSNSPGDEVAPEPPPVEENAEVWDENEKAPERVTVMTMLRSLETVRVKMAALEDTPPVPDTPETLASEAAAIVNDPSATRNGSAPALERPPQDVKPWSDVDLKPLSPPDRARRLQKARRALETPELRRGYLAWLFEREKDTFSIVSVRKEILEFAFDRTTFLAFDEATRARLARWIRERCAADQIAPPAVLAALRRATWAEGEPPQVDEKTRAIVEAATGALSRVVSEERAALFNRDFTAWLFSIREWEDREVLDRYARDLHPGVSEGLFRALAAMDGLSARFGGTGGQSALEIALGVWDRADNESRTELGMAISAGWSRGLVLDRRSFFDAFWTRYQQHEAQRPAILVALASFETEIEDAHAKTAKAVEPAKVTNKPPEPIVARAPNKPPEPIVARKPEPSVVTKTPEPTPAAKKPWEEDGAPQRRDDTPARRNTGVSERDVTRPSMRNPDLDPPPAEAKSLAKNSGFAPPPTEPLPPSSQEKPPDEGTDRFFRMMRKNMEAGMRAAGPAAAEDRLEEPLGDDLDVPVPDEGDAFADEGEAIPESSAPKIPPVAESSTTNAPPPAIRVPGTAPRAGAPVVATGNPAVVPASAPPQVVTNPGAPVDSRDEERVLPGEPLRSLSEYTRFLKALSAGRPIDELLSNHGMDYKQYAACMTAWGRLLQNRPDLALRMGQLLRAAAT